VQPIEIDPIDVARFTKRKKLGDGQIVVFLIYLVIVLNKFENDVAFAGMGLNGQVAIF
jgi:hypothetical protein